MVGFTYRAIEDTGSPHGSPFHGFTAAEATPATHNQHPLLFQGSQPYRPPVPARQLQVDFEPLSSGVRPPNTLDNLNRRHRPTADHQVLQQPPPPPGGGAGTGCEYHTPETR